MTSGCARTRACRAAATREMCGRHAWDIQQLARVTSPIGRVAMRRPPALRMTYIALDHDAKARAVRDARRLACVLEVSWRNG